MAVTRMQHALPIAVQDKIEAWKRPLIRLAEQMPVMKEHLAIIQWGGPVGVRDPSLPKDTGTRFAKALSLRDPGCAWHNDRSQLAELASMLARICGAIGKMGQDIALLAPTSRRLAEADRNRWFRRQCPINRTRYWPSCWSRLPENPRRMFRSCTTPSSMSKNAQAQHGCWSGWFCRKCLSRQGEASRQRMIL
ncbi:MAG: hypothetical protein U5K75_03880 [Ahrensia sp.]|nr:hypothetical protein [Ahrensia sp.]